MLKLIYKNLTASMRKSLATVFSLAVSVILIFTSLSIYHSFVNMRTENAYSEYGRYNFCLHDISEEEKDRLAGEMKKLNAKIGVEGIYQEEGCLNIVSADAEAIRMNNYSVFKGRLPEKEGEISLPPVLYEGGNYITEIKAIGDEVSIGGRKYIIVGFTDDFDYDNNEVYMTAFTYGNDTPASYNLYLHFVENEDYKKGLRKAEEILGVTAPVSQEDKAYAFYFGEKIYDNYFTNKIQFENAFSVKDKNIGAVILLFGIMLMIISLVLNIHVFYAYFGDRRKQAGILKSMGFANGQIISSSLMESAVLIFCGILSGLFVGAYVSKAVVELVQGKRIVRLANFSACLDKSVYVFTFLMCFFTFVLGTVPAIIKNTFPQIKELFSLENVRKRKTKIRLKKILSSDESFHRIEKFTIYVILILTGIIFITMGYLRRYVDYEVSRGEEHRSQFAVVMEEYLSGYIDDIRSSVRGISKFDVIYNRMGTLENPDGLIKNDMTPADCVYDNDNLYVDIYSVSEELYYESFSISSEISYEEFEQSGKAVLVTNNVLREGLKTLSYRVGADEQNYEVYTIDIIAQSDYTGFETSGDITLLVPAKVMSEIKGHKTICVFMNVEKGMEIEAAKALDKIKKEATWGFTVQDNVSEYINKKDDEETITCFFELAFLSIMLCVAISLFLILRHKHFRLERYFKTLKILGYSNIRIMAAELELAAEKSVIASLTGVFIVTLYYRNMLGDAVRQVGLDKPIKNVVFVSAVIFIIQFAAIILLGIRIRHQRLVYKVED